MRKYTLALSLVAHSLLIVFLVVAPMFATGDLPDPPRSTAFLIVTTKAPDIPPPAPQPAAPARTLSPGAAPVSEPDGVQPETFLDRAPASVVDDGIVPGPVSLPGAAVPGDGLVVPPPSRVPRAPVRPGGDLRPPAKIHHVAPEYPSIARSARVSGTVVLEAVIAEDGRVEDVRVLRSIRLLDDAAADAVRQWRFTPTLLNGTPVRVLMTVTVSFALN